MSRPAATNANQNVDASSRRWWPGQTTCVLLTLAALLALGFEAWRARQEATLNAQVQARQLPPAPARTTDEPRELRLARALQLAEKNDDRALAQFHALHDGDAPGERGDDPLALAARYNAANLLMRQGAVLRQGQQPGQAIALIELAKQGYRTVLRQAPDDWDARYNLERAQRLLPEPDEETQEPAEGAKQAERAATTMRAFSPGLP